MQLSGKKTLKMEPDVASIEKEKELAKGDAKLEDDNVLGLLQVYILFLRPLLA